MSKTLTVGELRAAIADFDDDVEIEFGSTIRYEKLVFYRLKRRGPKILQIALNDPEGPPEGTRTN